MSSSFYENLCEYGQKKDQKRLELLMTTTDEDCLIDVIKEKINSANFIETWNFILSAFRDTPNCHKKRIAAILCLLKQIEDKDFPPSRICTIVNRLCLELTKLKSEHLAKICSFCLESIQTQRRTKMGWKDLLPEVLNVLVEREIFTYDELEYTGTEYKTDFINTLCMTNWSPNIVTSLTSVFIDMPLTKEEHLKIVNKLGTYIEKLTPHEIPAFVYQLLRLCKQQHGRALFLRLQNYFGLRIYNNANLSESNSQTNSLNVDAIESADDQDSIQAESTVLYHIHTAASLGHECVKDYLNAIKNMIRAPEFVLHPFQLMVLFTISTISHYEENVFEIIRPCIVRSYQEEQRKNNSCWFRDMVASAAKPEEIFSQVIHFSLQDRELILPALVNFAFVLLGIGSALGRDPIAEKQWNLGNMILLKIVKRKRVVAHTILQTLSNHIVTRSSVSQYIECLYILGKTLPLLILENQSCIIELMDSLVQIQGHVANQLLDALIPLTKVSQTLRDHLIILLRKSLYSRSTDTRQMAVNGFLKMITQLKLSNLASLSQSSNSSGSFASGHSIYTQISLNRTSQTQGNNAFSNEALCLEILSILRRCFMQQAEVKSQLYEGLYNAVCMNPELGIPVLDLIWFHFNDYYIMDEEQLPPLNFKKIAAVKDVDSVLLEPLGKLIYTVGLIVTKVSENEDDRENNTVVKFKNILNLLCDRMKNCELVHFELDDGTDLLDIVPESQQKMHILKEAMSVYEALIGYKIYSWNKESQDQGKTINALFQGFSRLSHFSRTLSKPKKGDAKRKKGDPNKSTQPSQSSNVINKKDAQKHLKTFKLPDTVLDFETIKKALNLLHETRVDWTTPSEANVVKPKKEIHQHIMQVTIHLVQGVKRRKDIDVQVKKLYYDNITEVARVIFTRIINRLEEFIDFDCMTAILAMECFNLILLLINNHYRSNLKIFLRKVVSDEENNIIAQLKIVIALYQKLFEMEEDTLSDDQEIKKLPLIVITTLGTFASQLPSDSNISALHLYDWLKHCSYNNTIPGKVSTAFINLFFEVHIRYKISLTVLEQISSSVGKVIGVITQEEQVPETFEVINEATVHSIVLSLCSSVKSILEDIDALIARLKAEYNIVAYPGVDNPEKKLENLKTQERGVCCQICFVVAILTNLSNLLVQPGNLSEAIFKNIMHLFNTLSLLTKHFSMRSSKVNPAFESARFERLVKLTGKQLAPAVYKFIMHIEESQKQDSQATQSKKKSVDSSTLRSRVLKETRLIPKVIYEMEQFSKCVIQLSNKTKVDLSKYVGQGVVRDFRIIHLQEAIEKAGGMDNSVLDDTAQSEESIEQEQGSDRNVEEDEDSSDAMPPPPPKKAKR